MDYRSLGRTGVHVRSLCVGCWMFGNRVAADTAQKIVATALEAGVNFFDTANVYPATAGLRGESERILGRALNSCGARARTIVATKVHMPMDPADPNGGGVSRRHIIEQCEQSLRRLNTDWIDLYYLHRPPTSIPVDEALRALDDLIRSGKVRYIGTSHSSAWGFVESLWAAKELGLNRFVAEQPPYNILDRSIERELIPMARSFGVAVNPYMPLGGGLLTGLYRRGLPPPAGSRYADPQYASSSLFGPRFTSAVHDVNDVLRPLAESRRCSVASLAFNWARSQPGITSPILGPESVADLQDILDGSGAALEPADLAAIDAVVGPGQSVSPFYEPDRSPHFHRIG